MTKPILIVSGCTRDQHSALQWLRRLGQFRSDELDANVDFDLVDPKDALFEARRFLLMLDGYSHVVFVGRTLSREMYWPELRYGEWYPLLALDLSLQLTVVPAPDVRDMELAADPTLVPRLSMAFKGLRDAIRMEALER